MVLTYIKFREPDGTSEASGLFKDMPLGTVKVVYRSGREITQPIDDLPLHWIEQIRRWGKFGGGL